MHMILSYKCNVFLERKGGHCAKKTCKAILTRQGTTKWNKVGVNSKMWLGPFERGENGDSQ